MRALFLTQRLPYAPNRGDRIRAYHMLAALERRCTVDVASLVHDAEEAACADAMRARGLTVVTAPVTPLASRLRAAARLPTSRPLTLELLHSPQLPSRLRELVAARRPDVVFAFCSSMVRYALEPPLDAIPCVLDMVDLDSAKWAALASGDAPWPLRLIYRREAWCLSRFERAAVRRSAATLAVNPREAALVEQLVPGARVRVVENGIDVARFAPEGPPASDPEVVFCGVMNYGPNADAAHRLATRIWPLVHAARPDARLRLVGAHPTPAVRRLASRPGIEVTGSVPDVRPFLWGSAVAAVPLVVARGIQNKVLEALAAGLPVVVSPTVLEGIPEEAQGGCTVAGSDAEFAAAILALLSETPAQRRARAAAARLPQLQWDIRLASLYDVLAGAARPGGGDVCEDRVRHASHTARAGILG